MEAPGNRGFLFYGIPCPAHVWKESTTRVRLATHIYIWHQHHIMTAKGYIRFGSPALLR